MLFGLIGLFSSTICLYVINILFLLIGYWNYLWATCIGVNTLISLSYTINLYKLFGTIVALKSILTSLFSFSSSYYYSMYLLCIPYPYVGLLMMLSSFIIPDEKQCDWSWLVLKNYSCFLLLKGSFVVYGGCNFGELFNILF